MKFELLRLDEPNKNGRVYPSSVIHKEIERLKKEAIPSNRLFVLKQIPKTYDAPIHDVVGVITDLDITNNVLVATVIFLNSPDGQIFESLLRDEQFSIRTSGIGSIHKQENGTYLVGEDYEFTGCFVTSDPA